jgi:2-methylisocitrate lyase-like PEP mutase family enzyme
MRAICSELPGCKMANIVEGGLTPNLAMDEISELGYQIAAYPLTLLSAAMNAMKMTLDRMKIDQPRNDLLLDFGELRKDIGFNEYYENSEAYTSSQRK